MSRDNHESISAETMLGAILMIIGGVLLLDKLNLVEFQELARYWPVSLIGVGIYQLLEHNAKSQAR